MLMPTPALRFPALTVLSATYVHAGLGLQAGPGRPWPAVAGPGRPWPVTFFFAFSRFFAFISGSFGLFHSFCHFHPLCTFHEELEPTVNFFDQIWTDPALSPHPHKDFRPPGGLRTSYSCPGLWPPLAGLGQPFMALAGPGRFVLIRTCRLGPGRPCPVLRGLSVAIRARRTSSLIHILVADSFHSVS